MLKLKAKSILILCLFLSFALSSHYKLGGCDGCRSADTNNRCTQCHVQYIFVPDQRTCLLRSSITSSGHSSYVSSGSASPIPTTFTAQIQTVPAEKNVVNLNTYSFSSVSPSIIPTNNQASNWVETEIRFQPSTSYVQKSSSFSGYTQSPSPIPSSSTWTSSFTQNWQSTTSQSASNNVVVTNIPVSTPTQSVNTWQYTQTSQTQNKGEGWVNNAAVEGCAEFKNGACVRCAPRYYQAGSACRQVNDLCNTWDSFSGACTSCYAGYELSAGACVASRVVLPVQAQPGQGPAPVPGCAEFKNGACVRCAARHYQAGGACRPVDDLCNTWDSHSGACTSCYAGYELSAGACVASRVVLPVQAQPGQGPAPVPGCAEFKNGACVRCAPRHYQAGGACRPVDDLCNTWDSYSGACTSCYAGYELSAGACVASRVVLPVQAQPGQGPAPVPGCAEFKNGACVRCAPRHYQAGGACRPVDDLCNTWDSHSGACTSCYAGYELSAGACVASRVVLPVQAQPGQGPAPVPGCAEFKNGACVRCAARHYQAGGACRPVDDLCNTWDSHSGACTSCYAGYELSAGACVASRVVLPVQAQPGQGPAPVPGCAEFKNGACVRCAARHYQAGGACRPVDDLCNTWDSHSGACTSCYAGYELSAGACVASRVVLPVQAQPGQGPAPVPGCAEFKNGACVRCAARHYQAGGACRPVDDLCNTWDSHSGACTSCYAGYELSAGACVASRVVLPVQAQPGQGPAAAPGCAQFRNGACVRCAARHYSSKGGCRPVSDLCNTWDFSCGDCTSCYAGYELSAGACVASRVVLPVQAQPGQGPAPVPGCAEFKNGACVRCAARHYQAGGACRPVSDLCNTWDSHSGACTSCYAGYELAAGACVVSKVVLPVQAQPGQGPAPVPGCAEFKNGACVRCAARHYQAGGVCRPVDDLCNTWDSFSGACTSCYAGYELSAGACVASRVVLPVQAQPGQGPAPVPGCAEFKNGACVRCAARHYQAGGACRPVDDLCNTWDSHSGACTSCYAGYELSAGACVASRVVLPVQAQPGQGPAPVPGCAEFKNGACVRCAPRHYQAGGACRPVDDLCNTWDSYSGACTSCYAGYELSAGACVASRVVLPVQAQPGQGPAPVPGCAEFKNGACVRCAPRHYQAGGACRPVDDLCNTWDSHSGACTSCYAGYELSAGACVASRVVLPVQAQPGQGPAPVPGCAEFKNGACVRCAARHYQAGGACRPVDDLCNTWDSHSGACTSCYAGYELSAGACVASRVVLPVQAQPEQGPAPVPGCAEFKNGACVRCAPRYYQAGSACRQVNDLCNTWDSYSGACTSCYAGYELSAGACVVSRVVLPVQPQPEQRQVQQSTFVYEVNRQVPTTSKQSYLVPTFIQQQSTSVASSSSSSSSTIPVAPTVSAPTTISFDWVLPTYTDFSSSNSNKFSSGDASIIPTAYSAPVSSTSSVTIVQSGSSSSGSSSSSSHQSYGTGEASFIPTVYSAPVSSTSSVTIVQSGASSSSGSSGSSSSFGSSGSSYGSLIPSAVASSGSSAEVTITSGSRSGAGGVITLQGQDCVDVNAPINHTGHSHLRSRH